MKLLQQGYLKELLWKGGRRKAGGVVERAVERDEQESPLVGKLLVEVYVGLRYRGVSKRLLVEY